MSDWPFRKIGALGRVVTGKTPPTADANNFGGNYPFITIPDLGQQVFVVSTSRTLSELGAKTMRSLLLPAGSVLMSCIATIGKCGITTKPSFTNQQINSVICNDDVEPQFLYYTFKALSSDLESAGGGGSVFTNVSKSRFSDIEIQLPPKDVQLEIVRILGSIDAKIELNRQINQTLEQIAQTIFKSWFVDFEPVKAKIEAKAADRDPERAAMCAISGKLESELDQLPPEQYQQLAATAALFPDELVESELGLIPEGWEVKSLSEMVQLIGGGTPKRSNPEFWGGDIPWFSVQDAPAGGDVFVVDTEEKITRNGLVKSSTRLLPVGATIISARGTVGRIALVGAEMAMNQSCYGVKGADGVGPYFNYFNLKEAVSTLLQNTHGAVFDTITRQTFETVSCVQPVKPVLDGFEAILAPLMKKVCSNVHERKSLATLRDTLLPKLLSGELPVDGTQSVMLGSQ